MPSETQPRRIVVKIFLIVTILFFSWGFVVSMVDGLEGATLPNGESAFMTALGMLIGLVFFSAVLWFVWNKNRFEAASKENSAQPVLDLGSVVLEDGKEQVAYEHLIFDDNAKQMKFEGVDSAITIKFEDITKIYTGINIRKPALFFRNKENKKHTIFFVSSTEGARSLKTVYTRSLVLGELSAATSSADANRASYGQIFEDRVLRAEQWLKENNVHAYRAKMDRNAKAAVLVIVWTCLIIPAIVMTLISIFSN